MAEEGNDVRVMSQARNPSIVIHHPEVSVDQFHHNEFGHIVMSSKNPNVPLLHHWVRVL